MAVQMHREDWFGNTGCTQVNNNNSTANANDSCNSPESDSDNAHDGNDHRSRRSGRNHYLLAIAVILPMIGV